jgi:hypothetical protein
MINAGKEIGMDALRLIDLLIAVAFAGGGWFMNNVWSSIKDLQKADIDLAKEVSSLKVFVSTDYVASERFEVVMASQTKALDKLADKLDKLSDKIDTKMDKV